MKLTKEDRKRLSKRAHKVPGLVAMYGGKFMRAYGYVAGYIAIRNAFKADMPENQWDDLAREAVAKEHAEYQRFLTTPAHIYHGLQADAPTLR